MTPPIRPLTEADLDAAFALSTAAGWNQTIADWRHFLRDGSAWGIEADGVLAASAAVLPFGPNVAWVSMVLTLPDQRGRGYATALMAHALAALTASGHRAVLDATPFGLPVYTKLGFAPFWSFRRWRLDPSGSVVQGVRQLRPADWPEIVALDAAANGVPRDRLLRAIGARLPAAARVAVAEGRIEGFALARDGRRVIAADARSAWLGLAASLAAAAAAGAFSVSLSLFRENILPCLDELGGVTNDTVEPDLVVEMGTAASSRGPYFAYHIPKCNFLASFDVHRAKMPVARLEAVSVVDFDDPAIAAPPARKGDCPGPWRIDLCAVRRRHVFARMECHAPVERVAPRAIAACLAIVNEGLG